MRAPGHTDLVRFRPFVYCRLCCLSSSGLVSLGHRVLSSWLSQRGPALDSPCWLSPVTQQLSDQRSFCNFSAPARLVTCRTWDLGRFGADLLLQSIQTAMRKYFALETIVQVSFLSTAFAYVFDSLLCPAKALRRSSCHLQWCQARLQLSNSIVQRDWPIRTLLHLLGPVESLKKSQRPILVSVVNLSPAAKPRSHALLVMFGLGPFRMTNPLSGGLLW